MTPLAFVQFDPSSRPPVRGQRSHSYWYVVGLPLFHVPGKKLSDDPTTGTGEIPGSFVLVGAASECA
jgi:hypothetical protein